MANSRKLVVEVIGDSSKLDRDLRRVETRTQKFGKRLTGGRGVGGGVSGFALGGVGKAGVIGAGIAIGSAVALKGINRVVAAAKEAEVAQANLDQAFTASGISAAKYGKQVDGAIQATSKLSGFDDEDVSKSFASLLRTTGSLEKATRGAALAANIARARRISLAAATKIVEKAENGQLRGLKAVGVQIDKNTTSSEAIDRAQRKFAGSAEAYGRTAAGAQDKLGVALENIEERLGAKLLPLITKLALKLVDFLDWSDENWPKFAKAVQDAYAKAKPAIDATVKLVRGIANEVAGMVKLVHGLFTGDWAEAWAGLKQTAIDGVGGVVKALATLPVKIGAALSKKAFSGLSKIGEWIKDAVLGGLEGIGRGITDKIEGAINAAIKLLNTAIRAFNAIPRVRDIPQVPTLGSQSSPGKSSGIGKRPEEGTRGPIVVESRVYLDGRELNANQTPYRQKAQARNPAQRRGPNAGIVAG